MPSTQVGTAGLAAYPNAEVASASSARHQEGIFAPLARCTLPTGGEWRHLAMSLAREDIRDVNARTRVLAVAAALAITAAATACGSGSGTGNQRIGGATQGISIEVPGAFSVLDLTSETAAVNSIAKLGLDIAAVDTLVPQVKQFQQLHAALAVDAKEAAASSGQFPDNISAYCADSGTDLTGSSAVPTIKKQLTSKFGGLQVADVSTAGMPVGGVPGLEMMYLLNSSAGTLAAGQLEVAPKPQEFCVVTLTTSPGTFSKSILSTAAQTAQFT
jgi:hypothetical protein